MFNVLLNKFDYFINMKIENEITNIKISYFSKIKLLFK